MKHIIPSLLIALCLGLSGCGTQTTAVSTPPASAGTSPAPVSGPADPIVVNAEKTLAVAAHTFKFIAQEERENRAAFAKVSPSIHSFVDGIRRNGPGWLKTAEAMKTSYKLNRSAENRANMLTAISTVSTALEQSKQYLAAAGFGTNP